MHRFMPRLSKFQGPVIPSGCRAWIEGLGELDVAIVVDAILTFHRVIIVRSNLCYPE